MKNKIYTVALKGVLVMAISMAGIMVTFGQAPGWQWAKRAGGSGFEFGRRICTDPSGNIIVTGGFQSQSITFGPFTLLNTGGEDIFIVKYDVNGNVLWVKNPNGISYDFATDICTDYSGNIFITGNFQSDSLTFDTITLPDMYANASMFTAKYDPSGNIIWAKKTGNVWTPPGNGEYAAADVNGNCYVTGCMVDTMTFAGTTMTGYLDVFLVKYDSLGNELWAKSAMGNNFDIVNGISLDASGNLLVTGYFNSSSLTFGTTVLTNNGGKDMFIAMYDTNGNLIWAKSAGGINDEIANSVSSDAVGNAFITGNFSSPSVAFGSVTLTNSNSPLTDLFVVKYDPAGNVLWATKAGGSDFEYGNGISSDASGNTIITGSFYSNSITFGSYLLNNFSSSSADIFIAKYDPSGIALWAKSVPAVWDNYGRAVCTDSCNIYITGEYNSYFMIIGSDTLNNSGFNDMFVAKLACDTITGITEAKSTGNAIISPNPFTKNLNISMTNKEKSEILIYDISSRKLLQLEFTNSVSLNTELLAKGIYLFEVRNKNGVIKKGKIVKE